MKFEVSTTPSSTTPSLTLTDRWPVSSPLSFLYLLLFLFIPSFSDTTRVWQQELSVFYKTDFDKCYFVFQLSNSNRSDFIARNELVLPTEYILGTGITLPGRFDVSQTVSGPCWQQSFAAQVSSYPNTFVSTTVHVHTCWSCNRIISLMRRANTDIAPDKPIKLRVTNFRYVTLYRVPSTPVTTASGYSEGKPWQVVAVTTARRVFRLQTEERPPHMEGSCEYTE